MIIIILPSSSYRIVEGKGEMSPQQFLYRVWLPCQAPTTHEPSLLLYNETAICFFVEGVTSGNSIFTGKSFAMAAYHVRNQLFERLVAEGTYCLHRWSDPATNGQPPLQVLSESGLPTESGSLGIIAAVLIDALSALKKEHIL
jgi:hypothetical protein